MRQYEYYLPFIGIFRQFDFRVAFDHWHIIAKNQKKKWTWSVWWSDGFLRICTIAFVLFLTSTGGSNTAGQSTTLT